VDGWVISVPISKPLQGSLCSIRDKFIEADSVWMNLSAGPRKKRKSWIHWSSNGTSFLNLFERLRPCVAYLISFIAAGFLFCKFQFFGHLNFSAD